MKKKPEDKQVIREASCRLLATKVLCDYLEVTSVVKGVEIEHFYEDWVAKTITRPDKLMVRSVWRYFLTDLFEYRKNHKK